MCVCVCLNGQKKKKHPHFPPFPIHSYGGQINPAVREGFVTIFLLQPHKLELSSFLIKYSYFKIMWIAYCFLLLGFTM